MENEWEQVGDEPVGLFDLDNISAKDYLQQTYYMCEGNAGKYNLDITEMGTIVAFEGIDDKMLYMMVIPVNGEGDEW
jgi:hypothetical protein